ncbi:hypothetical protein BSKO_04104 [Bryopsis sp. KO-2023]|nr:hypothetical protein BSKO_04104 [Bryopsis sp. KO-2023]
MKGITFFLIACALMSCGVLGAVPSVEECATALEAMGDEAVRGALTPCAFGFKDLQSESLCCQTIDSLLGMESASAAAGCLCVEDVLIELKAAIDENQIAASLGFDSSVFMETLATCGAAHYINPDVAESMCPSE